MKLFKKYQNRNLAKQEHNYRMGDPMYDLNFNGIVKQIQEINKKALLYELMEAGGVAPDDLFAILDIEKTIEKAKETGLLTDLYTKTTGV